MFIFFIGGVSTSGELNGLLVLGDDVFFWIKVEIPGWFGGIGPFSLPAIEY